MQPSQLGTVPSMPLYITSEEMTTSELIRFQNECVYSYIGVEGVISPKLGGMNAT